MNKRTIIIVAALAVPLIALVMLTQSGNTPNNNMNKPGVSTAATAKKPADTGTPAEKSKQKEIAKLKRRLAQLEKMTPAQWEEERQKNPKVPATLAEALKRNQTRIEELKKMTPDEWMAAQKRMARRGADKAEAPAAGATATTAPAAPAPAATAPAPAAPAQ